MYVLNKINRGQIWWYEDGIDKYSVSFDDTIVLVGRRPVLVIGVGDYVTIIPFTSAQSYTLNSDIHLNMVPDVVSVLRTDQIQTVEYDDKFDTYMGTLDDDVFNRIMNVVLDIVEDTCPYEVNYTTDINKNECPTIHQLTVRDISRTEKTENEDISNVIVPTDPYTMVPTDDEYNAYKLKLSVRDKKNFINLHGACLKMKYKVTNARDIEKYKTIFKYQLKMYEKIHNNKLEPDDIKNIIEQPTDVLAVHYGLTENEINTLKAKYTWQ